MLNSSEEKYKLFSDPLTLYLSMLEDIKNAKKHIYLETYRFGNDAIGEKFRDALTKKSKEGIKIKLLLDSFGTPLFNSFFSEIIDNNGEIRFFRKFKFFFDLFTKNHRRNHRKLLLIDDEISYIGSANITGYSLNWRELVLRITGDITFCFNHIFYDNYELYKKYSFKKFAQKKLIKYGDYEIVRDIPSIYRQKIKRKFEELIRNSKKSVVIETPYFIPGFKLRKEIIEASQRGVNINIVVPKHSDVRLVDILRNKYLGILHSNKINILYYVPHNLHAKLMLVDDKIFAIGSSNFDYRSFRYQFEIMLIGKEKQIVTALDKHLAETLSECEEFNYEKWLRRPKFQILFEWILLPFRHLL